MKFTLPFLVNLGREHLVFNQGMVEKIVPSKIIKGDVSGHLKDSVPIIARLGGTGGYEAVNRFVKSLGPPFTGTRRLRWSLASH